MHRHQKGNTDILRQNTLICTDSISCLISLKNTFTQDPLILDIQDKIHTATQKGIDIAFVWVLGHTGIAGAAKQVPILEPLSYSTI